MCKEDTIIKIIKGINSKLKWEPLKNNNEKVLLWDYKEKRQISVVYRFIIKTLRDTYTIYVGSGGNLSGERGSTSLVYQYNHGNRLKTTRKKIEEEIAKFKDHGCSAWTEIISLGEEEPANKSKRKIVENLMILKFWVEYLYKSKKEKSRIPSFINQRIDLVEGIANDLDI